MKRIRSLHKGDAIYPAALRDWKLMISDSQGDGLGHISFEEDELYYCLFPLMRAHLIQTKMTVVRIQRNKGSYLRQVKAEIAFRIRMEKETNHYQNPDMNREIRQILSAYKREIIGYRG